MYQDPRIETLRNTIRPLRQRLVSHEVYASIETLQDVGTFMTHHVFAVWDFMSLLKALQRLLTCVSVPWLPSDDSVSRRLINELVLGEESDEVVEGTYVSHFELYRQAMVECGANRSPIDDLLVRLRKGEPVRGALRHCGAPAAAKAFVETTWQVIEDGSPHGLAAAFALGREELIPDLFRGLIAKLQRQFPGQLTTFQLYLDRHIQLDEGRHGPLAMQMLANLCGDRAERWGQAQTVAITCLEARIGLWDELVHQLTRATGIVPTRPALDLPHKPQ
jgi:hypothetical protein